MSAFRALRQVNRAGVLRTAPRSTPRVLAPAARLSFAPTTSSTALRPFSMSAGLRSEGASDLALAQKLAEELKYEKESAAQDGLASEEPDFVKDLKKLKVWTIEDPAGQDEVTLTRQFGKETIRVVFSVADLASPEDMEDEFANDPDAQEHRVRDGENAEEEGDMPNMYPLRVAINITKSSAPGALQIDALCQDGAFVPDSVSYYPDAQIGSSLTAEADYARRGAFAGPSFETLDVSVQEGFDKFMSERGIDETLAAFIPEYLEWKEQREYVQWLGQVKGFIEA